MKKIYVIAVTLFLVVVLAAPALALEKLVQSVADGCRKELVTYCGKVTPGEGRVLACLYAHGDKLSGRCEYALYDAAAQLERFVSALTYVVNECRDDLKAHCSSVKPGEGRLLDCIEKNDEKVSARCFLAIQDIGVEKK